MSVRCVGAAIAALLSLLPLVASAQSATYRLHNEASTTAGFKQLRTATPDTAATVLQTANLQGTAAGEKRIAEFDTASGVPGTAGKIPSGATVTAHVWMRKTANIGVMVPRVRVRLNNATGTTLCTATGTTALTTTLTLYTLTCTTTAHVTLTATNRLYVWAGVNLTTTSSAGAFRGELGIEGSTGGNYDSQVTVPTALAAPTIAGLAPSTGAIGASITINGNNFRNQQLGSTVRFFNNRTAAVTSWTNTAIVATVPSGTTTGAVTVTVAGTASNGSTFTLAPPPAISGLNPTSGGPGSSVVISGSSFGATQGTSTVAFNGSPAAVTSWTATQITTTVPAAATSGNVVVTVNGIASNGVAFAVAAAAPTLTPVAGTYPAGQPVTITSATAGATIYYTVNGQDPTTADYPLPNGGTVPVGSYTIKARAIASGYGASSVAQAAYQRDSTGCSYVVRPGALSLGGASYAGQLTVTPSSEFCDWTAISSQPWLTVGAPSGTGSRSISVLAAANSSGSVRSATITIGTTVVPVVQNVVTACTFAVAPSAVAAGPSAGGGTLTLTASDPACAWVAASDVSWLALSATGGVGDGTVPYTYTANTGSDPRWSGLTVGDQQVSVTQASTTALTVAGGTTPPANAPGWHRQDVTVVFSCAGPGTIVCADPVSVTTDGVHEISGQASNDQSQTASTTVTVRIDRVAPYVAVTFPYANSLVQPGPVTITGSVVDGLSDPIVVCNGALAAVDGGSFACTVAVASGTTNVGITALDAAGNQRSIVVPIATTDAIVTLPTNLRVTPQNVAMAIGEQRRFAMLDSLDRAPVDVTWTRTNAALSSLTVTNGVAELTALATGTTTLQASWRGLTATTTVTIVAANAIVPGTTIWDAPPLSPGATVANVLKSASTPAGESFLYAVERGATDRVRVFDAGGTERASLATGGTVAQLSGDPLGGAVVLMGGGPILQVGSYGTANTVAIDVISPGFAIHPDGPLYFAHSSPSGVPELTSVDIGLGGGRTVPLPQQPNGGYGSPGVPTVMPDGAVALPYVHDVGPNVFEPRPKVRLLLSRPDGTAVTYALMDENPGTPYFGGFYPYKAIPDGQGGYFVAYDHTPNVNEWNAMLMHVDAAGALVNLARVGGGQPGVGAATWFPNSSAASAGAIVIGPLSTGGPDVVVATYNKLQSGQLGVGVTDLTASGIVMSEFWLQNSSQPTYLSAEDGFVVGFPNGLIGGPSPDYDLMTLTNVRPFRGGTWVGGTSAGVAEMAGPMFRHSTSYWGLGGGDYTQGNSARRPRFVHSHPLLSIGNDLANGGQPVPPDWFEFEVNNVYKIGGSHKFMVGPRATHLQFLKDVAAPSTDALSFLGHSVAGPGGYGAPGGAVGLYFFDSWALTKEGYFVPGGTAETPLKTYQVTTIPSSFRVLFLGTCDLGSVFQSVWPLSAGQAIIHPVFPGSNNPNKLADLGVSATAWMKMMLELNMPGRSVGDAVSKGNEYVNSRFPGGPGSNGYFQFAVYGNSTVKLLP